MTPTRPHIDNAGSYTVTQACDLLAVSRRSLRRYEAAGLIASRVNEFGRRKYEGRELLKLWMMNY